MAGNEDLWAGLVGLAIIASFLTPKCPRCGKPVSREDKICPNCRGIRYGWT